MKRRDARLALRELRSNAAMARSTARELREEAGRVTYWLRQTVGAAVCLVVGHRFGSWMRGSLMFREQRETRRCGRCGAHQGRGGYPGVTTVLSHADHLHVGVVPRFEWLVPREPEEPRP